MGKNSRRWEYTCPSPAPVGRPSGKPRAPSAPASLPGVWASAERTGGICAQHGVCTRLSWPCEMSIFGCRLSSPTPVSVRDSQRLFSTLHPQHCRLKGRLADEHLPNKDWALRAPSKLRLWEKLKTERHLGESCRIRSTESLSAVSGSASPLQSPVLPLRERGRDSTGGNQRPAAGTPAGCTTRS